MSAAAVAIGASIIICFSSAAIVIGGAAVIDDAFLRLLGGHFVL